MGLCGLCKPESKTPLESAKSLWDKGVRQDEGKRDPPPHLAAPLLQCWGPDINGSA